MYLINSQQRMYWIGCVERIAENLFSNSVFFLNFTYFFKQIVPRYCTFSIYVVHFQHCMSNVEWSCTIQLGVSILDEFLNSIFSKTTPVTKKLYSLFSQFIFLSKITTFTEVFYIKILILHKQHVFFLILISFEHELYELYKFVTNLIIFQKIKLFNLFIEALK